MDVSGLRVERDGSVRTLRFARPEARNAFTSSVLYALARALDEVERDPDVRTVVLAGDERWFCTGLDLREAAGDPSEREGTDDVFDRLAACSRLVIAEVVGLAAAGGLGLAAACDLVVAGPRARFQLPEVAWGLCPAIVLPWIARRVGPQKARDLALTARTVGAEEAERMNLVDVLAADPRRAVATLARRNARVSPEGLGATKAWLRQLDGPSPDVRERARREHVRTFGQASVRARFDAFLSAGRLPWEDPDV